MGTGSWSPAREIASFYVDQEWNGSEYVSDGAADTNSFFGGRFVHPNDDWRWVLNTQRIGGSPGLPDRSMAGLEQIAGPRQSDSDTSKLNDFGFDGFFLDTIDTAGPFAEVLGYYPWAAEEMSRTVRFIHEAYPDMILMANRGVFFYNPAQADPVFDVRPFDYTLRPYIHAVVFESYLLDNDPSQGISPYFGDNKHNYGPKLMAEANRMDGFTVFSIDYQVGRGSALYDLAVEESVVRNGWIPFLAQDVLLDAVDTYVIDHPAPPDTAPPEWDSTGSPGFSLEDVPDRIGIQAVLAGPGAGEVLIQWDTARDQSLPIRYHVYQSTDPTFSVNVVKHANVDYQTGEGWNQDPASAYANQFTISGLGLDTYHFRVRAEDSLGLEEDNEVTLSITLSSPVTAVTNPGVSISIDGGLSDWTGLIPFEEDPEELGGPGNIIDWKQLLLGHDGAMLFIAYRNHGAVSLDWGHNLYLDVDSSRSSGFRGGGDDYPLGAEFLLQGSYLHRYLGNGTSWEWGYVGQARSAVSQEIAELMIPRAWIDRPVGMRLFLLGDNHPHGAASTDLYPDGALGSAGSGAWLQYDFARISNPVSALTVDGNLDDWQGLRFFGSDPVDAPGSGNQLDWRRLGIGHDAADLYFAYENNGPVSLNWAYNVYLDVDGALTTGFRGGGAELPVGAEYLLQGIHLYRYSGSGTGWSWTFVGTAGVGLSGPAQSSACRACGSTVRTTSISSCWGTTRPIRVGVESTSIPTGASSLVRRRVVVSSAIPLVHEGEGRDRTNKLRLRSTFLLRCLPCSFRCGVVMSP